MELTKFKKWMASSSANLKKLVAHSAGTSVSHLYQVSSGHRNASAELARRIEFGMRDNSTGYDIDCGDLSETCKNCPFRKKCKGIK